MKIKSCLLNDKRIITMDIRHKINYLIDDKPQQYSQTEYIVVLKAVKQ